MKKLATSSARVESRGKLGKFVNEKKENKSARDYKLRIDSIM